MTRFFCLLFSFLIINGADSQNTIGLPDIINYSKQTYRAGAQNRKIRQDKRGIMYFANNEGVLTYDGINWKIYPLPNKSIVRCIEFGPDNRLYAGGQDEFGYFSPDSSGSLVFHSLKNLIPASNRSFNDVWEIYFYRDLIFFQTSSEIFQFSDQHCTVSKSRHWWFLGLENDRLIAQDIDKGVLTYQNGMWTPFLTESDLPSEYVVTSLLDIGRDSLLLTTQKNGLYILSGTKLKKLRSPSLEEIETKNVSSARKVNETHIALSTSLGGCYIIDKKGEMVQVFTQKEGLQNNNIQYVFLDKEKNLWLGLDNGIDFIAYNNAIKHIYPDNLNGATGYAASIYHNELYIGTSNGLYKTSLYDLPDLSYVKGVFQPVLNSRGQVWNLSQVNGKLLMGHHDGAFVIENNSANILDGSTGFWIFQPYFNVLPSSLMVAGTYDGINFYNCENGRFTYTGRQAKFESSRFVVIDNNNIWVAHPYRGIYRVSYNGDSTTTKYYSKDDGVPAAGGNYVFRISNRIILTTESGIFEYNASTDKFEASKYYNDLFGRKNIRYMKEDGGGNIWFIFDKILGVVDMTNGKPQILYFPELTNKFVSGFEFIYPINKNNVFMGGERGFYHINYEEYKKIKYELQVEITQVKVIDKKDVLLFGGYSGEVNAISGTLSREEIKIPHEWNSIHFEFTSPAYSQLSNVEYSYFLEGFDERWSEFSRKTEKEYTNLPSGNYTFKVKSRNNLGKESKECSYTFTILAPWYASNWANAIYGLFGIVLIYFLYIYQRRKFRIQQEKHEREQKHLQHLHRLETENAEKEIIKLRNEKLEAEIQHKNIELASTAMHLVQKGELLGKVKDQVTRLKKMPEADKNSDDIKKILRAISDEEKMDEQWEQFAMHFDKVHSDFLRAVKEKYPNLTPNELKLCAYLRMNLATKEIAQLMNISVRGVEISRYRLRKKLGIPTEVNLFNFLMEIKPAGN